MTILILLILLGLTAFATLAPTRYEGWAWMVWALAIGFGFSVLWFGDYLHPAKAAAAIAVAVGLGFVVPGV